MAEVYRRLGECENLKENFEKAQEEIQKAIDLLEKEKQSEVNRALSEAYFLMSCTVNYQAKADSAKQALGFLDKGITIIQNFKKLVETEMGKLCTETGKFWPSIFWKIFFQFLWQIDQIKFHSYKLKSFPFK